MRIKRTLPPAAAPIRFKDIVSGLKGLIHGRKEIRRFEDELKVFYNVRYCFLVSSGKAALTILLRALHDINPQRDEVLIPAFTCYSVPAAVLKAGLKVKLCDIDPVSLDFDFLEMKKNMGTSSAKGSRDRLLAVLPTHLLGLPADVENVKKTIATDSVFVVEDAAQAMGGEQSGKKLGTRGDAAFFSLGRGKAFSTVEGGIVLTDNKKIGESISRQINRISDYTAFEILKLIGYSIVLAVFMKPNFFWFPRALPFLKLGETLFEMEFSLKKFSAFQAGLARNWEKRLPRMVALRRLNAGNFTTAFQQKQGCTSTLIPPSGYDSGVLRFPMKIDHAPTLARIIAKSDLMGLGIMRAYPDSINHIEALIKTFKGTTYPNATRTARQLITLPVHPFLSPGDCLKIRHLIDNASCVPDHNEMK